VLVLSYSNGGVWGDEADRSGFVRVWTDPDGLAAAGAATVVAEWLSALLFLVKFASMKPAVVPILEFFPPWADLAPVVQASAQVWSVVDEDACRMTQCGVQKLCI
jgi:hypothetical protein